MENYGRVINKYLWIHKGIINIYGKVLHQKQNLGTRTVLFSRSEKTEMQ